jgi:hypothetical protein
MLFVNGKDDDATTCAFSRGCCEVSGTAVKPLVEDPHSRKYCILNVVKTNIPLRCKESYIPTAKDDNCER